MTHRMTLTNYKSNESDSELLSLGTIGLLKQYIEGISQGTLIEPEGSISIRM